MTHDDVSCHAEDDTVRCTIDGQKPDRVIDGHRETVKDHFGRVASMESCVHISEAYLQERDAPEKQRRDLAASLVTYGCPIHDFNHE
jgi:hypothetical protein